MEIKRKTIITLSDNDIKEIVAQHLNSKGMNVKAKDVALSVGSKIEGYGVSEHYVHYFKECRVEINE